MENQQELEKLASLFQMFSEPNRLKIIQTLYHGEQSVGDLAEMTNLTISNVSHQLKNLKNVQLVKSRKEGKYAIYSLDDDHVFQIFQAGKDHILEH